jgi:hypothetical protein
LPRQLQPDYTLVTTSSYRGYPVQYQDGQSPLIREALDKFINQVEAIATYYQDIFLVRFDLHLPTVNDAISLIGPTVANDRVSELFAQLRENKFRQKQWGGQSIKRSAYGWCSELESAKQLHYHCWIAVPKGRVENAGSIRKRADGSVEGYGLIGMIHDLWQTLNPEGAAHVQCDAMASMRIKTADVGSMAEAIHWISYMAKQRGKLVYTGEDGQPIRVRRFDGSRLKPAVPLPRVA